VLTAYSFPRVVAGCFWHFERVYGTQSGTRSNLRAPVKIAAVVHRETCHVHALRSSSAPAIYFFFNSTVVVVPRADTE
jgi:hypothetical protein